MDNYSQLTFSLLGFFGIMSALEGILIALIYSKVQWGNGKKYLKSFVFLIALSMFWTGILIINSAQQSSFLQQLGLLYFIPIAVIMICGLGVALFVVIKA